MSYQVVVGTKLTVKSFLKCQVLANGSIFFKAAKVLAIK